MTPLDLRPEELAHLEASKRCDACGHLEALHNGHCCEFCMVPQCPCKWEEMPCVAMEAGK